MSVKTNEDGSILISAGIDSSGITKGVSSVEKGVGGLSSKLSKLGGIIASAFAVRQIIAFAKQTESAYEESVAAEVKLTTIMKQRMNASDEQISSVKSLAAEMQKYGVVEDDTLIAGAQQVSTFLKQADSVNALMPAMANLLVQQNGVNATAENAVNIGNLMGKALQGNTGALQRVGITFNEAQANALKYGNESQRVSTLAQVITDNVGQMNAAFAQTDSGKQQQMANTWGEVQEKIGSIVSKLKTAALPIVSKLVGWASNIADYCSAIFNYVADIFGWERAETSAVTSNVSDTVSQQEDLTSAVEDTTKANKKQLASFDDLNVLAADTAENAQNAAETVADTPTQTYAPVDTVDKSSSAEVPDWIKSIANQDVINGLQKLKEILTKAFSEAIKIFGGALKILWDIVKNIDTNVIVSVLMGIAGGILAFKITTAIIEGINFFIEALGGIGSIASGPVALAVGVIAGLAIAIGTLLDLNFEDSGLGEFNREMEQSATDADNMADSLKSANDAASEKLTDVDAKGKAIDDIATKYFNLADKTGRSAEETNQLKSYARKLVEYAPELDGTIDKTTGKYTGQKQAILEIIDANTKKLRVQAAEEAQYDAQVNIYKAQAQMRTSAQALARTAKKILSFYKDYSGQIDSMSDQDAVTKVRDMISSGLWLNKLQMEGNINPNENYAVFQLASTFNDQAAALDDLSNAYKDTQSNLQYFTDIVKQTSADMSDTASSTSSTVSSTAKTASSSAKQDVSDAADSVSSTVDSAMKTVSGSTSTAASNVQTSGKTATDAFSVSASSIDGSMQQISSSAQSNSNTAIGCMERLAQSFTAAALVAKAFASGLVLSMDEAKQALSGKLNKGSSDWLSSVYALLGDDYEKKYFQQSGAAARRRGESSVYYHIPGLATGAVLPANRPFLAALGDQSNGKNLEAPEGLIRQIVREESGNSDVKLTVNGNMAALFRYLNIGIEQEKRRASARG